MEGGGGASVSGEKNYWASNFESRGKKRWRAGRKRKKAGQQVRGSQLSGGDQGGETQRKKNPGGSWIKQRVFQ